MTDDLSVLLLDSAMLLVVGMSVVFIFLTILIFAIHAIEWISNKLPQTQETQTAQAAPVVRVNTPHQPDAKVVAAITAAVHQYRQKQQ